MNQLMVTENKAIAALPVAYQQIVAVRFRKPIKDYDGYELETGLKNIVQVALAELGHTTSGADPGVVTFLRESLCKDLKRPKFSMLTLEEVKLFISNGIRGEYGTFKNQLNVLNVQNIHFWIKAGMESRERREALEAFNRIYLAQNSSTVPLHVKIRRSAEGALSAFEYWKREGRVEFCGFAYYDVLNELIGQDYEVDGKVIKTLITDPEARREIVKNSVTAYREELRRIKAKAEFKQDHNLAEAIGAALVDLSGNKTVENKIKEKMLVHFFESVVKNNIDLKKLLEESIK